MKKIKILHFVSGLISGGVEQMLYNYCKFMDHEKYEFVIVYQHVPVLTCIEKMESIGCKTIRITARSENFIKNIKDSIDVIQSEKPDIVHAHMNLMNFCALYAAKKCGVKVRISHSHIAEKNKGIMFNMMANVFKQMCIKYATAYFACGEEAGLYMYGKKKMEAGEVTIIQNAIDLQYFSKNKELNEHFRQTNNLNGKFIVGHIGRFSQQKNHNKLIDIFNEILKINENSFLLLVGTGELEDEIRRKVASLGISNNVLFYGTTDKMNEIYSVIDVLLLPSLFEGLPVVSIEVQAANVPAVFSSSIAPICKITDAIRFVDLNKNDKEWAEETISHYLSFKPCDLTDLQEIYDIRSNEKKLDNIYNRLLNGV